jgi:hypothetical protein
VLAVLLSACRKCKLYRYEAGSNEWKERGLGVVKLLKHKENGKIRLLMRQEKTLKIRANHIGARTQPTHVFSSWGHVVVLLAAVEPVLAAPVRQQ